MKTRGLTVLEVIIALGILAVAVLSLVLLFTSGLKLQRQSADVARATAIGRSFLESVRSQGFSNIPSTDTQFDGRLAQSPDASTGFPPTPYPSHISDSLEYRLVVNSKADSPRRKSVQVQVYWDHNSKVVLESSFFE